MIRHEMIFYRGALVSRLGDSEGTSSIIESNKKSAEKIRLLFECYWLKK